MALRTEACELDVIIETASPRRDSTEFEGSRPGFRGPTPGGPGHEGLLVGCAACLAPSAPADSPGVRQAWPRDGRLFHTWNDESRRRAYTDLPVMATVEA